nr:hypothetical protein [Ignavibacteria bacterium]
IKKTPVGGGLGGGSSNAASIIKFLINYYSIDINSNKAGIIDMAMSIGSDVPFFLTMKPCYAEGRGERLKLLKQFDLDFNILIVNPNLHISTKWAFESLNIQPGYEKSRILQDVKSFDPNNSEIFENEFEKVVFKKYNILKEIKNELIEKGAVFSSMSGSGATMYGLFEKNKNTELYKCRSDFRTKNYFTFIS